MSRKTWLVLMIVCLIINALLFVQLIRSGTISVSVACEVTDE